MPSRSLCSTSSLAYQVKQRPKSPSTIHSRQNQNGKDDADLSKSNRLPHFRLLQGNDFPTSHAHDADNILTPLANFPGEQ